MVRVSTIVEPRWLSTPQQAIWRDYLNATARINEKLDAELRSFGLDLGEYEILVHLSESPELQMRMSDLASAVRQSRSRLTHTVTRMERKGLILRKSCPSDRRGVIAVLTGSGLTLLKTAAPTHVESVREVFIDRVDPDDLAALGRAMNAVVLAD